MNTPPQVIKTRTGVFVVTEYMPAVVKSQPPASIAMRVRTAGTRTLTTSRLHRRMATVPYIRLAGHWLREAGIEEGMPIAVTVTPQGITITAGVKP